MKTIVTHIGPDLDAITSVWLVKMFFTGWEEASIAFVPAGTTLDGLPPDQNPDILHVDTGFGRFDHHQTNADTCASLLLYEKIVETRGENVALRRLVQLVNDFDHFREVYFPNPTSDVWNMTLGSAIDGWRLIHADNQLEIVALGMNALDGIYKSFQTKTWAEKELKEHGKEFATSWGKAIGIETVNDDVIHLGQKMGYVLVVRKDLHKGYVRIKSLPRDDIDLESVYNRLMKRDSQATWFLHASHHMVLNGSSKNPAMRPSTLTLGEIIDVIAEPEKKLNDTP
ncbi:MAG: hypothetical protein Q7S76_03335 [bacterium]|nr:hypothetical protein [bacterium]